MVLPSVICAIGSIESVTALLMLLKKSQNISTDFMVSFDFVKILHLEPFQAFLMRLDDQRALFALLIILGSIIGGGLLIGLTTLLLGLVYNLMAAVIGGIEVEAELS